MTTNGLKRSPPPPETLPPKKRSSKENSSDSSEHIFKTPSLFWNRNGFRRIRRTREPVSLVNLYSSAPLYHHHHHLHHQSWPDVATAPGPFLSHPIPDNATFPTWGQHFANVDHLYQTSLANSNVGLYGGPSYWSYVPSESRDAFVKSQRKLHNQHRTPIIKPIPHSPYDRGPLNKEEATQRLEEDIMRASYWQERLQNQRALQEWKIKKRDDARHLTKPVPGLFSESDMEISSSYKRTEDGQRQSSHRSSLSDEQSVQKWRSEVDVREQLPPLARSGSAEGVKDQQEAEFPSSWLLSRFVEGSLIELAGGKLKRVEELKVEDFEYCSESCPELSLKRFTVRKITPSHAAGLSCLEVELEDELHSKLSLEVCEFYPFFVCHHGWSSCSPERTDKLCNLRCRQLQLGDVCLALAPGSAPPTVPISPAQTYPGGGDGGHLDQLNCKEKPKEAAGLVKNRKRHCSAPELRF